MIRLAIAGLLTAAGGLIAMLAWELGVFNTAESTIAPRPGSVAAAHPVVAANQLR